MPCHPSTHPPAPYQPHRQRLVGLAAAAIAATPLVIGAGLKPNPAGLGTHLQLGLQPCGFLNATGLPCATCGMTTAVTHAAHGHLLSAATVQPAGTLFALLCAATVLIGLYAAVTGLHITRLLRQALIPRVVLTALSLVLLAWLYTAVRTV